MTTVTSAPASRRLPPAAALAAERDGYVVDVGHDVEAFLARVAALDDGRGLPFHAVPWLRAWYATLGRSAGRSAVLVGVRSRRSGADVLLLPLTSRRAAGVSVVEFADASVVDYQLPIFAPGWAGDTVAARSLWRAVRDALAGHDVVRIDKLLAHRLDDAGAAPNPLMLALPTVACEMYGNQLHVAGSWESWQRDLPKRVRKEFERSWRVFTRSPGARFEHVTDPLEAARVFEQLERQQSARMREQGVPYLLDRPEYQAFYRRALEGGLADGSTVLTALRDGDELVAGLFGVANGARFIALRLSTAGAAWAHCSPGRLLLERSAAHLHAKGLHWFDFGIGDYAYKTVFGVAGIPLFDAIQALSWRGWPVVWAWRARRMIKRQAWLVRVVRRLKKHDGVHVPD